MLELNLQNLDYTRMMQIISLIGLEINRVHAERVSQFPSGFLSLRVMTWMSLYGTMYCFTFIEMYLRCSTHFLQLIRKGFTSLITYLMNVIEVYLQESWQTPTVKYHSTTVVNEPGTQECCLFVNCPLLTCSYIELLNKILVCTRIPQTFSSAREYFKILSLTGQFLKPWIKICSA